NAVPADATGATSIHRVLLTRGVSSRDVSVPPGRRIGSRPTEGSPADGNGPCGSFTHHKGRSTIAERRTGAQASRRRGFAVRSALAGAPPARYLSLERKAPHGGRPASRKREDHDRSQDPTRQ